MIEFQKYHACGNNFIIINDQKHINDDWWFTAKEALEYGICDEITKELIY